MRLRTLITASALLVGGCSSAPPPDDLVLEQLRETHERLEIAHALAKAEGYEIDGYTIRSVKARPNVTSFEFWQLDPALGVRGGLTHFEVTVDDEGVARLFKGR